MSRRKRRNLNRGYERERRKLQRQQNKIFFNALIDWFMPAGELFAKEEVHGNVKWTPNELAVQGLIWAWQEARHVTDGFTVALEVCDELKLEHTARTYTVFMNALNRYEKMFGSQLRQRLQALARQLAGRFWSDKGWVLIGFDGSRVTAPRTISNENEFCAPNYGKGRTAQYRKKKLKGMRRRKNEKNKPQPQVPQVWITMLWHMGLRLPWTWRLGPSNSSERGHVMEILEEEKFSENTLFCGDAGFVGYDFWRAIVASGGDFLIRVGGNVSLLSEKADIKSLDGGIVLCWPKDKRDSGNAPLRLRLVKVKIGKTSMWMLTSVLDDEELPIKMIIKYYKMRWGIEVEFRGLKQSIDKRNLRCRKSDRAYVELDWSIRAMAFAELTALREQIPDDHTTKTESKQDYDTKHRSLANAIRALRKCMRKLNQYVDPSDTLLSWLSAATVQKYKNSTDKKARYRPKNPDKKPLGEPKTRKLNPEERKKLKQITQHTAA